MSQKERRCYRCSVSRVDPKLILYGKGYNGSISQRQCRRSPLQRGIGVSITSAPTSDPETISVTPAGQELDEIWKKTDESTRPGVSLCPDKQQPLGQVMHMKSCSPTAMTKPSLRNEYQPGV